MGSHLIDGEFQSDKYPTCPRGKVPLSVNDPMAQDLLWEYARRRRVVDDEFAMDLFTALKAAGYPPAPIRKYACTQTDPKKVEEVLATGGGVQYPTETACPACHGIWNASHLLVMYEVMIDGQ